jgi:hypothetical protein
LLRQIYSYRVKYVRITQEAKMAQESVHDHKAFAQIVQGSLQSGQARIAGLRKTHLWLLLASIVSSAITTLVAGVTAAAGPVVSEGVAGWRLACIVAAVFGFASTACTTLTQEMKIGERLVQGTQCVGRLKALDVAIATGSHSWEEITKEYTDIVKVYPDITT